MTRAAFPLLSVLLLAGCGGRLGRSGLAGTYVPILIGQESTPNPPVADGQNLEIRDNGTFLIRGFPKVEGRAEVKGDLITLTVERAGDKPVADLRGGDGKAIEVPPLLLRRADGGSRLVPDVSNRNPLKFTWVRAKR